MNTPTIVVLCVVGAIAYVVVAIFYMRFRYMRIEHRRPWSFTSSLNKDDSKSYLSWSQRLDKGESETILAGWLWPIYIGSDLYIMIVTCVFISIITPFGWLGKYMARLAKGQPLRSTDHGPEEH